jgi:cytochrome c553
MALAHPIVFNPGSHMTPAQSARLLPLAALLFLSSAFAADAPQGNPKAGRALVYTCGGCHGVAGYVNAYPNYHVPRIAGQNFDYLVAALTAYKKGDRAHPTMRAQGESLSEQDITNIAAYLSSLTP